MSSRTRSFGGCGTCRARRTKCDETRPTCSTCAACNLVCDGYNKVIFFDTKGDEGKARHRQLLFTDEERQHMGAMMTNDVPLHRALAMITDIEDECEEAIRHSHAQIDVFRGPFGAFRIDQSTNTSSVDQTFDPDTLMVSLSRAASPNFCFFDAQMLQPPQWLDASSLLGDYDDSSTMPLFPQIFPRQPVIQEISAEGYGMQGGPIPQSWSQPLMTITSLAATPSFEDAPLLIKNYASNYIPSLTPFRHTKTPWHILFLPNAKNTLANIAIGENVDSANLVTFLGTLSISALDLHRHSSDRKWHAQAAVLKQHAQDVVQEVIAHALDRPKSFKYKSIIMAIMTMAQLSMANGCWDQTDVYLLEAEKIIRLRGLTKTHKSRKVRMLHHCYAYTRVLHESLTSMSVRSDLQRLVTDAVDRSGTVAKDSDRPCFRLTSWNVLDQTFQEIKTREQGENDLHLSRPGFWSETLYPEIYGVPETWMYLLSQVIRLGNEREMLENGDERALPMKEYTRCVKTIERHILQWKPSVNFVTVDDRVQISDVDWILLEKLQSALHHGLIVYFYRRIYDIESQMLQCYVKQVQDVLSTCRELCGSGGLLDSFMWPAFVAGCEALDPELQTAYSAWFRYGMKHDRPSSFARMYQLMREVWDLRHNNNDRSVSWWQLQKGKDTQL